MKKRVGSLFFILLLLLQPLVARAIMLEDVTFKNGDRIGIFIGTFSPPHAGHDQVMRDAIAKLSLDYVIIVPNDLALHKKDTEDHRFRHRLTVLAYQRDPKILVPSGIKTPIVTAVFKYLSDLQSKQGIKTVKIGLMGSDVAVSTSRRMMWTMLPLLSVSPFSTHPGSFWSGFVVSSRDPSLEIPEEIGGKPVTVVVPRFSYSSTKARNLIAQSLEILSKPTSEEYQSFRAEMSQVLHPDVFDAYVQSELSRKNSSASSGPQPQCSKLAI